MRTLPSGTVTFLFTDVEGSTRLLQELGAEAYAGALSEHRRALRAVFAAHDGVEVDTQGDAFFVAFPTAPGALAAAAELTEALADGPIRVRVGVHTGTPFVTEEGYVGVDVHRAARIAAAGYGAQVLVSASTAALADGIVLRDLGEHRFKDLSAAERVFQLGADEFPPLKTLFQTNLPVPATPFLGRGAELAEVVELLRRQEVQLLTLIGPGGTGKTRLALQAAAEAEEAFPDGLWWVSLSPLRDPALVLPAVASGVGIREESGRKLVETLARELGGKRLLLLLDNAEHLLPDVAETIATLRGLEGTTLLVTSRERLRLQGEQVYPVASLEDHDGIALFLARARALDPAFASTPAVDELCRRLDRLPLAIELAAARTTLFSAEQLLDRLAQRLDLLQGGRDADPRQQTLRATIAWSHDLLHLNERALLRRLAIFAGGCTYDAAESVCCADADTLGSLLDKSLVRRRIGADGDPRYWLLETIREFALEQLARSGEAEEVGNRHSRWCLDVARGFETGTSATDTAAIEQERDNMSAALERALQSEEPTHLLELVAALWHLWDERSQLLEGQRWADAALERSGNAPNALRIEVTSAAARFARDRGQFERAGTLLEDVRALAIESGDDAALASALTQLGRSASLQGDHEAALELLEQAVALRRAGDNRERLGGALYNLGLALVESGGAQESLGRFREAGEILAAEESEYGIAVVKQGIGWALLVAGEYASSLTASADGVRLMRPIGDTYAVTLGLANIAFAVMRLDLWEQGSRLGGAADAQQAESGYAPSATDLSWALELESAAREGLGDSEYERLTAEGATLGLEAAIELALELSETHGASVD